MQNTHHGTHDIPHMYHDIPHGTQFTKNGIPRDTEHTPTVLKISSYIYHDIPPTPSTVLKTPHGTEHTLYRVWTIARWCRLHDSLFSTMLPDFMNW